jgi:hypothetical protein
LVGQLRTHPGEQQRRTSNRERCRDLLFSFLREASALLQPHMDAARTAALAQELRRGGAWVPSSGPSRHAATGQVRRALHFLFFPLLPSSLLSLLTPLTPSPPPFLLPLSLPNQAPPGTSQQLIEAFLSLRTRCLALLSELHPSNLPYLADVLTSCVLQAASTGEIRGK